MPQSCQDELQFQGQETDSAPPVAAAAPAVERRLSPALHLFFRTSSPAAAGLSSLGSGSLSLRGSQDLANLLEASSSFQHTPRSMDLDLLSSPKWNAVLPWEASGSAVPSPGHPDTTSSSGAASHTTAMHFGAHSHAGGCDGGALVSPGVEQPAAAEAAWCEATALQAQLVLHALDPLPHTPRAAQLAEDREMAAELEAAEDWALGNSRAAEERHCNGEACRRRRASGLGKKRPSFFASATDALPGTPTAALPPSKQLRFVVGAGQEAAQGAQGCNGRPPRAPGFCLAQCGPEADAGVPAGSCGDALMLDAEAAAADAAACAAAFDAAAAAALLGRLGSGSAALPERDCASPAGVAQGLGHMRLGSIGGNHDVRRLTAAAAAAAVTPAGRLGSRVLRRGDSQVAMLVPPGMFPASPTCTAVQDAQLVPPVTTFDLVKPEPAPAKPEPVRVEINVHTSEPPLPGLPLAGLAMPALSPLPVPLPWAGLPGAMDQAGSEAAWQAALAAAMATMAPQQAATPVESPPKIKRQVLATKSHKAVATGETGVFTSAYRGVTRHRLTGRFEAHFWDSSYIRPNVKKGKRLKGRQVYVGGYETELEAARAYDRAVIAYLGTGAPLNFPAEDYADDLVWMAGRLPEEVVSILRKGSVGFARGRSQYRGVTQHSHQSKWESRIGRVEGCKYMYLGCFDTAEEAARAYDRACVKLRGAKAILNFDLSDYQDILDNPDAYDPQAAATSAPATSSRLAAGAGAYASIAGMQPHKSMACPEAGFVMAAAAPVGGCDFAMHFGSRASCPEALPGSFVLPLVAEHSQQLWHLPTVASVQPPQYQPSRLGPGHPQPLPGLGFLQPAASPRADAGLGGPTLRLPAIRTRTAAPATAASAGACAAGAAGDGARGLHNVDTDHASVSPMSASLAGADLAGFLLSPLAASLLSPLGTVGSPSGWRDSPLSRFFFSDTSGAGAESGANAMLTHGGRQQRRTFTGGSLRSGDGSLAAAGALGSPSAGGTTDIMALEGMARLFSTPASEAHLTAALQWMESLDAAQLSALLDSPAAQTTQLAQPDGCDNGGTRSQAASGGDVCWGSKQGSRRL